MRARTGLAAVVCVVLCFGAVGAQDKDKDKPTGKQAPRVDQGTGKKLNEALEKLNADKPGEARQVLSGLNLERLSPYERSRVEQLFAAIDQSEEKYVSARDHLQKALASGGLNDQEMSSVRFQIAQLFMAEEKWREGIEALKQWFANEPNPNAAAFYMLAVAYYQLDDLRNALEPAQKAVEMAGARPQESWLQLLAALRIKREEYALALPVLRQLVEAAPAKKNYWIQLSSASLSLGNYEEAAVPMQLAYHMGLLDQDQELRRLAQLLIQIKIPYRAAEILARAVEQKKVTNDLKAFELLGNSYIAAREFEKAVPPLQRAAEMSDTGDLWVRVAEVHVQKEKWPNATDALRKALEKGRLKNPGSAQLLLGISLYSQKKIQEARPWFERAMAHTNSRSQAEGWIHQVDQDLQLSQQG